ncbi:hypothetical protein I4U23_005127 [Adineta vaga]|nr:hypothetical protein I4U23_005127 [Adineta vaga]
MNIYLQILFFCSFISMVISKPPCYKRPICAIYCQYGNRLDAQGCPTCSCKSSPCENDAPILDGYNCGFTVDRKECPETHYCKIAPNDAYAVCCPRQELETSTTIIKPGECPKQTGFGICIARCTNDSDCGENEKCCGNCPRQCIKV